MIKASHKIFEALFFLVNTMYMDAGFPRCSEERGLKFQQNTCNPLDAIPSRMLMAYLAVKVWLCLY